MQTYLLMLAQLNNCAHSYSMIPFWLHLKHLQSQVNVNLFLRTFPPHSYFMLFTKGVKTASVWMFSLLSKVRYNLSKLISKCKIYCNPWLQESSIIPATSLSLSPLFYNNLQTFLILYMTINVIYGISIVWRYTVIDIHLFLCTYSLLYQSKDGASPNKKSLQLVNHQGIYGAEQDSWDQWADLAPGMSAGSWSQ